MASLKRPLLPRLLLGKRSLKEALKTACDTHWTKQPNNLPHRILQG
ncbi:MAG: hypothetical protein K2X66_13970 [Cyanobacteria bacterium]|nr:hypothetical protein [Cyanobacteriota bacterium]